MVLLNGVTQKLAGKADMLGKLYGYFGRFAEATPAGGDVIGAIIWQHEQAINAVTQGKMPKLTNILGGCRTNTFKNGLFAWLAGELADPILGHRSAAALKKFGTEAMKWSIAAQAVIAWKWNPHNPDGGSSSYGY